MAVQSDCLWSEETDSGLAIQTRPNADEDAAGEDLRVLRGETDDARLGLAADALRTSDKGAGICEETVVAWTGEVGGTGAGSVSSGGSGVDVIARQDGEATSGKGRVLRYVERLL